MEGLNYRVLFYYRLLVQAGQLDDDLFPEHALALDWPERLFFRIVVDEEACIGCYACHAACPYAAIRIAHDLAWVVDPAACILCPSAPCVMSCPTSALTDRAAS